MCCLTLAIVFSAGTGTVWPKLSRRAHCRVAECGSDLLVQIALNCSRRSLRRQHEIGDLDRDVQAALADGRYIRQLIRTSFTRDGEGDDLAGLHLGQHERLRVERRLNFVGYQRLHHWRVAAVWHMDHLDLRQLDELQPRQMLRTAQAR